MKKEWIIKTSQALNDREAVEFLSKSNNILVRTLKPRPSSKNDRHSVPVAARWISGRAGICYVVGTQLHTQLKDCEVYQNLFLSFFSLGFKLKSIADSWPGSMKKPKIKLSEIRDGFV